MLPSAEATPNSFDRLVARFSAIRKRYMDSPTPDEKVRLARVATEIVDEACNLIDQHKVAVLATHRDHPLSTQAPGLYESKKPFNYYLRCYNLRTALRP